MDRPVQDKLLLLLLPVVVVTTRGTQIEERAAFNLTTTIQMTNAIPMTIPGGNGRT